MDKLKSVKSKIIRSVLDIIAHDKIATKLFNTMLDAIPSIFYTKGTNTMVAEETLSCEGSTIAGGKEVIIDAYEINLDHCTIASKTKIIMRNVEDVQCEMSCFVAPEIHLENFSGNTEDFDRCYFGGHVQIIESTEF